MTATPTTGDNEVKENNVNNLSARLLDEAAELVRIDRCDEDNTPRYTAGLLREAAAALSALPAAGGLAPVLTAYRCDYCGRDYYDTANCCESRREYLAAFTTPQPSAAVLEDGGPPCSTHPDAPHGFNRNASHTEGRYVCDCEGWKPDAAAEIVRDLCELDPYDPDAEDAVCVRLRDLELIVNRALNSKDAAVGAQGDGCDCGCNEPAFTEPMEALRFLSGRMKHAGIGESVALSYARDIDRILAAPAAGKDVDDDVREYLMEQLATEGAFEGLGYSKVERNLRALRKLDALTRQPVAGDGGLAGEVHSAALGVAVIHVDCSYFGPHMIGPGKKVRIFVDAPAATPTDGGEG